MFRLREDATEPIFMSHRAVRNALEALKDQVWQLTSKGVGSAKTSRPAMRVDIRRVGRKRAMLTDRLLVETLCSESCDVPWW